MAISIPSNDHYESSSLLNKSLKLHCDLPTFPDFPGLFRKFDFTPGILLHNPRFFTSRSMRCVIVVRVRDFKISIHTYTYYVFDSALYLCPARDVKVEKRLDVCTCRQGKRASKITLSRTHEKV